jgi:hypothetical protein
MEGLESLQLPTGIGIVMSGVIVSVFEVVVLFATAVILVWTARIMRDTGRQTRAHYRSSRVSYFIARFNSTDMLAARNRVHDWLDRGEDVSSLWDSSDGSDRQKLSEVGWDFVAVINFFQELGAARKHEDLDPDYIYDVVGFLTIEHWERLEAFVRKNRERRGHPTLYSEFEELAEEMRRR